MELRPLRYFVAVARTLHFGQAAERLHMAQSPLSQAIRQLEAELGVTLFDRTTRRVQLTAAGEAFLRDAEHLLAAVEEAQDRARQVAQGSTGVLRIGSTGLAALRQLPRLARIAARDLPGLVLRFVPNLLTPAQELALAEDRIDLALLRPPVHADLAARLVARERFVLAVGDEHRLAGADAVGLAALRDEAFVVYDAPGSAVTAAVERACLGAGFLPRRVRAAGETATLLTHVAAGLGVALLPESVEALRVEGVRYRPVADDVHVDLTLAWRPDRASPALTRLVAALEADGFVPGARRPAGAMAR